MARSLPLLLVLSMGIASCATGDDPQDPFVRRSGGDLIAGGTALELVDTVAGDVLVAGRSVRFSGAAGGSYLGVGGDQEVRGRIDGSVRAAAGRLLVSAEVGRNVTAAAGELILHERSVVQRNAYLVGGRVEQTGRIAGHLRAAGGEVTLNGAVGGNVDVVADRLTVGPEARINGELRYRVDAANVSVDPAAVIGGGARALPPVRRVPSGIGLLFKALRVLAFLLAGVVVVALLPGTAANLARTLGERIAPAFGMGLVALLLTPILVAVAVATVIGIPLALLALAFLLCALYLAPVVPSVWLGRRILEGRPDAGVVLQFVTGGVLVALVILVPWIGWVARIVATCFGLGAVALWVSGRRAIAA